MPELTFHPAAAAEYEEALHWYAERSGEIAEEFEQAVSRALQEISNFPERWPLLDDGHRIMIVATKFPYQLIYREIGNELTVIALAHHRRRPGYWQGRE